MPYERATQPIKDDQGRIRIIVDFMDEAQAPYAEAAREAFERFELGRDRHNPQALLLLDAKSRQYGIEPVYRRNERGEQERAEVTTWLGASFAAYLTPTQIDALRRDEVVRLLTEDHPIGLSAPPPPWYPSWNGLDWTELNDWGWNAVGGKSVINVKPEGSNRVVWIVDNGVAHHNDLPSVISRYNVDGYSTVGCYAHATHVAGIIGAASGNGEGRRGIYAGVQMRSINGGAETLLYMGDKCALGFGTVSGSSTAYGLGVALDYIFANSIVSYGNNTGPNVVNISMNGGTATGFSVNGYAMSNQPRVAGLAQPSSGYPTWLHMYPGNVVVQSAGNINQNACNNSVTVYLSNGTTAIQDATYIYKPTAVSATSDPADGILVVGALNSDGQRASPFSTAYPDVGGTPFTDPGSNYGDCIDIWAPGNFIYSTWGEGNDRTDQSVPYGGGQPSNCSSGICTSPPEKGWAHLSGTSMAAPHVAAAAAYYIDKYGLTTPAQVEQMLRSTATGSPGNTSLPSGLNMVQLQ